MDQNQLNFNHPYPNYDEWKEYHKKDLENLFYSFENEFKDVIDTNIEVFNIFCELVFDNSTKKCA